MAAIGSVTFDVILRSRDGKTEAVVGSLSMPINLAEGTVSVGELQKLADALRDAGKKPER